MPTEPPPHIVAVACLLARTSVSGRGAGDGRGAPHAAPGRHRGVVVGVHGDERRKRHGMAARERVLVQTVPVPPRAASRTATLGPRRGEGCWRVSPSSRAVCPCGCSRLREETVPHGGMRRQGKARIVTRRRHRGRGQHAHGAQRRLDDRDTRLVTGAAGARPQDPQVGVVSTVARKPPLSVTIAIFGIVCQGYSLLTPHPGSLW